tara:strand:+ start:278 stop:490 length:213 start_codon:yes stop_codon:yes gene_type:complete
MSSVNDKWVQEQILRISKVHYRVLAFEGYKKRYDEAFALEPIEYKKENTAMRTANLALTAYVNKVLELNI